MSDTEYTFEHSGAGVSHAVDGTDIMIEGNDPTHDKGTLRATVVVYDGDALAHTDNLNITSASMRDRFVKL